MANDRSNVWPRSKAPEETPRVDKLLTKPEDRLDPLRVTDRKDGKNGPNLK